MPPPAFFSVTCTTVDKAGDKRSGLPLVGRPLVRHRPSATRVLHLLAAHRPREALDAAALAVIDAAYAALLVVAPPRGAQRAVRASAPADPDDPFSPLLHVDASPTHCRVRVTETRPDHAAAARTVHRLAQATVTISPGAAVHLSRCAVCAGGGQDRTTAAPVVRWRYVDASSSKHGTGLVGVLRAARSRLDEAIWRETTLIDAARDSGFGRSPRVAEMVAVRAAMEDMRAEVDVDAILRRKRCYKRRRPVRGEMHAPSAADMEDAEMLAERMTAMHVDDDFDEEDDEDGTEVLTKRLKSLHV